MHDRDLAEIRQAANSKLEEDICKLIDAIKEAEHVDCTPLIEWQDRVLSAKEMNETIFKGFKKDLRRITDELQTKKVPTYNVKIHDIVDHMVETLRTLIYLPKTKVPTDAERKTVIETVNTSIKQFKELCKDIYSIKKMHKMVKQNQFITAKSALVSSYEEAERVLPGFKKSAEDRIKAILTKKMKRIILIEMHDFNNKVNQIILNLKAGESTREKCVVDIENLYVKKFPEKVGTYVAEVAGEGQLIDYIAQKSNAYKDAMASLDKACMENEEKERERERAIEEDKKADLLLEINHPINLIQLMKAEKSCADTKEDNIKTKALIKLDEYWKKFIKEDILEKARSLSLQEVGTFDEMPEHDEASLIQKEEFATSWHPYPELFVIKLYKGDIGEARIEKINRVMTHIFSAYYPNYNEHVESFQKKLKAFILKADILKEAVKIRNQNIDRILGEIVTKISPNESDLLEAENNCQEIKDEGIKRQAIEKLDKLWVNFITTDLNEKTKAAEFDFKNTYELNPAEKYKRLKTDTLKQLVEKKGWADKIYPLCNFLPKYEKVLYRYVPNKERKEALTHMINSIWAESLDNEEFDDLPKLEKIDAFLDKYTETFERLKESEEKRTQKQQEQKQLTDSILRERKESPDLKENKHSSHAEYKDLLAPDVSNVPTHSKSKSTPSFLSWLMDKLIIPGCTIFGAGCGALICVFLPVDVIIAVICLGTAVGCLIGSAIKLIKQCCQKPMINDNNDAKDEIINVNRQPQVLSTSSEHIMIRQLETSAERLARYHRKNERLKHRREVGMTRKDIRELPAPEEDKTPAHSSTTVSEAKNLTNSSSPSL